MREAENPYDINRYVNKKIFEKISGESIFEDYETLLEKFRKSEAEEELKRYAAERERVKAER